MIMRKLQSTLTGLTAIRRLCFAFVSQMMDSAERKAERLVYLFVAVYSLFFSGYTILMHYTFKTYAWDLGVFTQVLWSTVNSGQPFHYTIEFFVNPSQNFFGTHFSPVLFLVLPFYAVFQSPLTLLVLQSFVIGLAGLPIYWIGRDKLHSRLWGLTFAVAFLLHPAVHSMNCFDFHVQAFVPLFFLLSFYYLDNQKWLRGILFAVLTLSTIEFAPILILALLIYFIIKTVFSRSRLGSGALLRHLGIQLTIVSVSVAWFLMAFQVMYTVNPAKTIGLPGNWDNWGRSMSEVVLNLIRNPVTVLGVIVTPIDKVYYVFSVMMPLLLFPFAAPLELFLASPWLLAAMLSQYPPYYQYYYQYFGLIAGQILIAAIYGARNLLKSRTVAFDSRAISGFEKKLMVFMLSLGLVAALAISPVGLPSLTTRRLEINSHVQMLHEILGLIPPNASVATQNDILPHLAQRREIFLFGWPKQSSVDSFDSDYILVDTKSSHFFYGGTAFYTAPNDALATLLDDENMRQKYGVLTYQDGILLLKKDYSGSIVTEPYEESFNFENLIRNPVRSYVGFDASSRSGGTIVYDTHYFTLENDRNVWFGPYVYLFGGIGREVVSVGWNYSATFVLKTKTPNSVFTIDAYSFQDPSSQVSRQLTSGDFSSLNQWQEFTIYFMVRGLQKWEFRGWASSNNTYVALDYVQVSQVGP